MPRPLLLSMLFAVALQTGCSDPAEVQCMPGWSLCAATCTDLLSDSQNCGACDNACAADESCVSGACAADCTKQLHAPIADPWGLAWDGLERPRAIHSAARSTCEAIGGRLPTLSELHRVSAVKTGAVGDTYRTNVLWALTPSDDTTHMAIRLSDGVTSQATDATVTNYRCVCPPSTPDAFVGAACQGSPGEECFSFSGDETLNYDSWDRPLATKAAAIWDCAFSGGQLLTPERLAAAITAGLPNGSNAWLHTGDQESNVNGTIVKWSNASWIADGNVSYGSPTALSPFRCAGPSNAGTASAASLTGGVLAEDTGVVADGADHGETVAFPTAVDRCFDAGGHLPTTSELASVAMQGLTRVSGSSFLWTGDETCSGSASTYSWTGIAAWPGVTGATVTGVGFSNPTWTSSSAKTSLLSYRCIYYPVDATYAGPAECNGGCKRYDLTNGRGTGPAATIWLDNADRAAATYASAAYACAGLGGRLASARDLVEGIKNGLPGIDTGTPVNVLTSDIGCGSATIYAIPQWSGSSNDAYQDNAGVSLARTASAVYRCMWTNEIR